MTAFAAIALRVPGSAATIMIPASAPSPILPVGIGENLFAHGLEEPDQESAGAAGGVADDIPFLRVHHADHEFDDTARGEELADLATEGASEEPFEGNALGILEEQVQRLVTGELPEVVFGEAVCG